MSAPGGMYYLTRRLFACFLVCFEFAMLLVCIFPLPVGGSVCLSILSGCLGGVGMGGRGFVGRDLLLNSYIKIGNCKQCILLCTFIKY